MKWWEKIRSDPREFFDSIKTIAIAIFAALLFRSVVAAPYKIPTGSMIPTLKIGDFIFVSKLSYGLKIPFTNRNFVTWGKPKRGDVIVFRYPLDPGVDYIKRVVAVEGDLVELRNDVLYVNDRPMPRRTCDDRSSLADQRKPEADAALYREKLSGVEHYVIEFYPFPDNFGPYKVPEGTVFMMGDNRDNSKDSRAWGPLSLDNVRGRALFVWLSLDTEQWRLRWERFGNTIR